MHFHLPKPLHGWREFFGEVGIIVVGVLIALALEQVVQSAHERTIAAEARDAVRAEMQENLWWLERRAQIEPCVQVSLVRLANVVELADHNKPIPVSENIGLKWHSKITSLRWDANAQSGRASLFSANEQRLLGNMYFSSEEFRRTQAEEEDLWSKMSFVNGLDHLSPLDIHDLRIFLASARYRDGRAKLSIRRAHQWAERLQLTAANPNGVEKLGSLSAANCPSGS